ncbi:hypothetical protein GCM10027280_44510 [Micromonospora polyrhachis]|uniref:Cell division protein FtsB n=1 Tax=Micromonospora polyrhachis TaxID=1282883 RepID=A0A7W7SX62_9ACTN|nr:hypothetical protein [Micromonospora polyrhachis]MBB4961290.1 hypothetical protein [Micromonospora polyrhachis]
MNESKRDRREHLGADRGVGQRVPRSGGRIVAERTTRSSVGTSPTRNTRGRDARARGVREFPTQGTAALQPQEWEPATGDRTASAVSDRINRARAGAAHPASGGPARVAPPRLKVAPPPPVRVPQAPFVALILAVVVGGVLGILVVNTKINENAFRLDKLQKQQASLDIQEQQLQKEIAQAEAPGNLAARARKLGLVESGPPAFIRLPDGRVIGIPQPAGGEPAITSQQGTGG